MRKMRKNASRWPDGPICHLAKNRNGPTGDVPLHFEAELMRFSTREADEHDQESE